MTTAVIYIRPLIGTGEPTLTKVNALPCVVEDVVYLKNDNCRYPEEKYIAYDFPTGLSIAAAKTVRELKEKVESLKERIEEQRKGKTYDQWNINKRLL